MEFVIVVVALVLPVALALVGLLRVHLVQAELREVAAAAALAVARDGGGTATAHRVVAELWSGPAPGLTVRCRSGCGTPGAVLEVRLATEVALTPMPGSVGVAYTHAHVRDRFDPPSGAVGRGPR